MTVRPAPEQGFDMSIETLVIGAGACGMTAALAAQEAGDAVLVLEADSVPTGSTALSAGLIPAAGTRYQADAGIDDDAECFAADIQRKASGEADPALLMALCVGASTTVEWLADKFGLPFSLVSDFDYPGHARRRMHGLPTRSGGELMDALRTACEGAGIDIVCDCRATTLFTNADGTIAGIEAQRPDGSAECIGCDRLILACNGFGGAKPLVAQHMPDIASALYFGHDGNRGEAVGWGAGLGAATRHLDAYQGHGNVAHPHGILITWAVITQGGFQVNSHGQRFWNEAQGYSEAARAVLAQPGGTAVTVFDDRIAGVARQFKDFRDAEAQGAVREAATVEALAEMFDLPVDALEVTFAEIASAQSGGDDPHGRDFSNAKPLAPPYRAVRVTGALFHTQGGLDVMPDGRVKRETGGVIANLYAAGGAACGVSGSGDAGYLSGNGLLSAVVLGRIAGVDRGWKAGAS